MTVDLDDTVFISVEDLQRMLGIDRRYEPTPDDETPTKPEVIPEAAYGVCRVCRGKKTVVIARSPGHVSARNCHRCGGTGVESDPGSR